MTICILWHRRMGHAHQCIIKHLRKNTDGGPHQTTKAPTSTCEGCEKGKPRRLPFPTLKSRAKQLLILFILIWTKCQCSPSPDTNITQPT